MRIYEALLPDDFILTRTGKIYFEDKEEGKELSVDYYLDALSDMLRLQGECDSQAKDFFRFEMEIQAIEFILKTDFSECHK